MQDSIKCITPRCPSSQPEVEGAAVFAIIEGSSAEPRAAYLDRLVPLTPEIVAGTASIHPAEVFRLSAPCAAQACRHFDNERCGLVNRLVQLVPSVVSSPPACVLRPSCLWWLQEGIAACLRCPQVVTHMYGATPPLIQAATPQEHR